MITRSYLPISCCMAIAIAAFLYSSNSIASCSVLGQCDSCTTDTSYSVAALGYTPGIPPGSSGLSCEVHVANMGSGTLKRFFVTKLMEQGTYYEQAYEMTVDPVVMFEFNQFFLAINDFNSSPQSITIPSGGLPFDSAYGLAGNSQNQDAVHSYITSNHTLSNIIYQILAGSFSLIDLTGSNLGSILTILVEFSDGSSGVFKLEVGGLMLSKWLPVEETFYDSDGNRIFFDSGQYDGQSGSTTGGNTAALIDRLFRGGWQVGISGSGDSCSFSCAGNSCTLSCSVSHH